MQKSKIVRLVEEAIQGTDQFIVDVSVKNDNLILVYLDADSAVTIADCIKVSRHIEDNLDREIEDFELRVSSAGLDYPIRLQRQFVKNTGKLIAILCEDGEKQQGKLLSFDKTSITIEKITTKKQGKLKKESVAEPVTIPFTAIKEIKSVIIF
jgi:ribosome maturation factor RimP